ncbi:protein toll-like [Leptopilina boulardi]|uniref:protein toll-like n=1 Tax=Leptopilina boulardi TaxID=63433 RepID=UPI0021F5328D|nr:protein toll-like [Leptopilina boulardi]
MQAIWNIFILFVVSLIAFAENNTKHIEILRSTSEEKKNLIKTNKTVLKRDDFPEFSYTYESLVLHSKNEKIMSLPKDFLKFFPDIKFLDLGNNKFERFENKTFENLSELKFLNISNNKIVELSSDTFNNLMLLKYLNLGYNELTTLPREIFAKNINLKIIGMSSNHFESLPEGLFENNKNLQLVRLRKEYKLTNLPSGLFSNLKNLSTVNLSYSNLKSLPANLFKGSNNLRVIKIVENALQTLPDNIFDGLVNLENLELSGNKIDSLPDNIFESCINLQKLLLGNNSILTLSRFTFNGLQSLRFLNMSYNKMINIYEADFAPLKSVTHINLSHNNIAHVVETKIKNSTISGFIPFRNLEELNLSYNKISSFSINWIKIPQIHYLNLSNNILPSLSITDLDLRHSNDFILDVSFNKIKTINLNCENYFHEEVHKNITLLLNDNPLKCDGALYNFLRFLDNAMRNPVREKLFLEIGPMKCLVSKDYEGILLSDINLKEYKSYPSKEEIKNYEMCPKACDLRRRHYDRTFIIDCSNRNLTEIPETLCFLKEKGYTNELNLSGNFIKNISNLPQIGYDNLTNVFLSNNQISNITLEMLSSPTLRRVKLDNNLLSLISPEIIRHFSLSKITATFGNNPWICCCENDDLREMAQCSNSFIQDSDDIICVDSNLPMKLYQEMCGINTNVILAISVSVALMGLIFASLTIFYCLYKKKIKIWLYTHNICLWFVTEVELDKDKQYDAFISYSHKDEEFVINELVTNLELRPRSYKLCIHFRDWPAGEWIPSQISRSIRESSRTIFIISTNFINSEWAKMEFRAAHKKALSDGMRIIIIVLYGDIGPIDKLEPDLKSYLKMNTYVKWGDPWFWDKLRYALPHKWNAKFENTRL